MAHSTLSSRKLVVFDWDGTLADSLHGIVSTAREVLLGWGMREEDLGDLTRLVGPPFPQAYSMVYGLSDKDAAEVTRRYRELYAQGDVSMWPVFDGVRGLLDRLRLAGKLIAVASSKRHGLVMRQITDNGLVEAFDAIHGKQSDHGDSKEAAILRAMEELGCSAADTVMVGDRHFDVYAATDVGIPCVGVLWGGTAPRAELEEAGAVAIAETIPELEGILLG